MSALANVIREWLDRNDRGIHGQNELARAAGIRTSTLSYIMNKKNPRPYPGTIKALAKAMGVEGVVLTALLGYPVQASSEPSGQYILIARQLEAFPWLVERLDDFLLLPESDFRELMDYLAFRRRQDVGQSSP